MQRGNYQGLKVEAAKQATQTQQPKQDQKPAAKAVVKQKPKAFKPGI